METDDAFYVQLSALNVETCRQLVEAYDRHTVAGRLKHLAHHPHDVAAKELQALMQNEMCCGQQAPDLRGLRDQLGQAVAALFGLGDVFADYSAYSRLTVGGRHPLHADAVTLEGKPNHTAHRVATAIVYLTPTPWEFIGGRIVFPGLDRAFTPSPGLAIGFPSTLAYRHEVERVARGRRDALLFWYTKDERFREAWPDVTELAAPPPATSHPSKARHVGPPRPVRARPAQS